MQGWWQRCWCGYQDVKKKGETLRDVETICGNGMRTKPGQIWNNWPSQDFGVELALLMLCVPVGIKGIKRKRKQKYSSKMTWRHSKSYSKFVRQWCTNCNEDIKESIQNLKPNIFSYWLNEELYRKLCQPLHERHQFADDFENCWLCEQLVLTQHEIDFGYQKFNLIWYYRFKYHRPTEDLRNK